MAQEWAWAALPEVPKFLSSRMPERWAADVLDKAAGGTSPLLISSGAEEALEELAKELAKDQVRSSSRAIVVGPS